MKLGSLFDGSGTCPLAATLCGIEPVWASEIEPYPIKVTKKNFPQMKHLGDVTQIKGDEIEPVDIITFGSPCQDLSVAGKRAGIHEGERSSLFFEAIRIIKEMREKTHGRYPTVAVWENVPGAFSSNRGRDFLAVLQAFVEVAGGCNVPEPAAKQGKLQWGKAGCVMGDGFSLAWRMLDAQYWGVPQRRKRIYLVADFAGGRAPEILFKREGLSGDSAESGATREGTADDAAGSARGSNRDGSNVIYALHDKATRCQGGGAIRHDDGAGNGLGVTHDGLMYTLDTAERHAVCFKPGQGAKARTMGESEKTAPTLASEAGGNSVPGVCYPNVFHTLTAHNARNPESAQTPNCVCYPRVARTLTGDHENRVTNYTATIYRNKKFGEYAADGTASTMAARDYKSARDIVVEHPPTYGVDCRNAALDEKKTHTLQAKANGGQSPNCTPSVLTAGKPPRKYTIRRLTPLECCRLQGFPDWWEDGVEGSDTARYKMWGNGMALPCILYVMQGIADAMRHERKA